jgi:vancomycin resistance protein YoaR
VTELQEDRGGRVVLLTILGLLVLFGGAYVAAYLFAGDKVPRGANVAGVDVGGRSHDDAVAALRDGFEKRATIDVSVGERQMSLIASEAGLSIDHEASVEAAGGGRSWAPARLWNYYTGGDELEPVLVRDDDALEAALARLDKEFGTAPREGAVRFQGESVRTVAARPGKEVDRATAPGELSSAYTSGDTAELALAEAQPEIDQADVQQALNEFANAAVSAPVTLRFDNTPVRLRPREYTPALSMVPRDGELVPRLDRKALGRLIGNRLAGSPGAPVPATVRLVDGKPKVIPDKPGVVYPPADISRAFLALVVREAGNREMAVKATVRRAKFRTADARALKIKERVSTFTTYYPHAGYRNVNIGRAAELIDGTVLKPGETFSLNDIVGERTAANGFTEGFIISNGVFKEDLGGGVSQIATTAFNAMFFAGLEDVEHKPHSFYIDRYPIGREATVAWGALDLRFRNDTPYGVLVAASIDPSTPSSQGSVTVSMWSTEHWDISTRTGDRYNFTEPGTRTLTTSDCYPNSGYGGFDIDVWRYFRKPGSEKLVRTEKFHTTYTPSDTVICEEPPSPSPSPSPTRSPSRSGD